MGIYYELFNPNNFSEKLDLNLCSKQNVEIRIPINIKQYKIELILKTKSLGYNIFDLNNSFYNDICSVFTYNDSDISLSERRHLLDLSDENLCMVGCNYSNIDINTLRSICICKISNANANDTSESKDDKNNINIADNNFLNSLTKDLDISKASNIKVVQCFEIIFGKKLFTENYGFYIMLFMNFFNIITLIISPLSKAEKQFNNFCLKLLNQLKEIYNKSDEFQKNEINLINIRNTENKNENTNNANYNKNKSNNSQSKISNKKKRKSVLMKTGKKRLPRYSYINTSKNTNSKLSANNSRFSQSNINLNKNINNNNILPVISKKEKKIIQELKEKNNSDYYIYNLIKYIPFAERRKYLSEPEIESLSYKNALNIENRKKSNYYFSLLKEKNKIISMILNDKDFNISSVKISLFIVSFNLSLTINALFFNDEAIYEINQDEGSFNLSTQITRVLYSAIISGFIGFIAELLALTHGDIIKLRYFKDIKKAENEIPKLIKKLKFKYVLFYGLTIFFNIIFFYYITAFCAIYTIIQTHMITDSLMSFLLTMSYTLILSLISSVIRISSLKKDNNCRHFFYIISWVISLI